MDCKNIETLLYDYANNDLDNNEISLVENHLKECSKCHSQLKDIKNALKLLSHWEPAKLPDDFTESLLNQLGFLPEYNEADDHLLLAASSDETKNSSYGVAIDKKTKKGFLAKIEVSIKKQEKEPKPPNIQANVINGMGNVKFNDPREAFAQKIFKRFQTIPSLASLNLHKKDIYVEITTSTFESHFYELNSLTLAVITAIYKAAININKNNNNIGHNLILCADIGLDGKLTNVGQLKEKIEFVCSKHDFKLIISQSDYKELKKNNLIENNVLSQKILAFNTFDELINKIINKNNHELINKTIKKNDHENINAKKTFDKKTILVLLFMLSGTIFFMYQLYLLIMGK